MIMEHNFVDKIKDKYTSIKATSSELIKLQDEWFELAIEDCRYSMKGSTKYRTVCNHKNAIHPYCGPTVCIMVKGKSI